MRRAGIAAGSLMLAVLTHAAPAFAQSTGKEPAGGAAIGEAIGATAGALLATALVAYLVAGHRSGRIKVLARAGAWAERHTGLPAWASLPSMLMGVALLTAVLGMYWDISLHIDNGRDAGPLANPAHYLILIGLYGVLVAGVMSIALAGTERPAKTAVHLGGGWWAPIGGLMMAACGAFALTGFPLDDMWHRLFGQDVTLWGPTHLMLIGGASLATLGGMVLMGEAITTIGRDPDREATPWVYHARRALLVGGFLVALTTFQAEFDFGVPQFRAVHQPILIMLAAGIGLVTTRLYLGRGGALLAVCGYVLIRGFLTIMVGGVWGQTTPHFPLYIVEALIVEAVFARAGGRSPVVNGAIAGALIGTIGLAAEWAWSHIWMPIPWNSSLLPEAAIAGIVTAVAAGAVGGFIGGSLTGRSGVLIAREDGRRLVPADRRAALVAGLALMAVIGWALPMSNSGPERAQVALRDIDRGDQRTVAATIRLDPRDSVEGSRVHERDRLAGRRQRRRPARAGQPGRLPDDQADPRLRRLEVDAPHPAGRRPGLDAAVHAEGRGDPRCGGAGRGELHARLPARHRGASARAQAGSLAGPEGDRVPDGAGDRAGADRADRVVAAADRPRRGPSTAAWKDSARPGRTRVKAH